MSISIITPVLNGATTIRDCIESVRRQSIPVEHILVDGGSTDGTLGILADYAREGAAKVIAEQDDGVYDAMNKGIAVARGDVVGILNADDFYAGQQVLATVTKAFADPAVMTCYGDLIYVKESSVPTEHFRTPNMGLPATGRFKIVRYWKSGAFRPEKFYWGWMPPHPTFFVRRDIYEKYGVFNLALGTSADYELMLRLLLKHGVTSAYIPEVLVKMRIGGMSNSTLRARLRANLMDRKAWEVNGLKPLPWTLLLKPLAKITQFFLKKY